MKGYLLYLPLMLLCMLGTQEGICVPSNPEKIYSQASVRAASALEREFAIESCGAYGKSNKSVEMIRLSFVVRQKLNRDEARKYILPLADRFIAILNADKQLQPYMSRFPFNYDNIELTLYFEDKEGQPVYQPNIHMLALKRGQLKYGTLDEKDPYPIEEAVYESLTEAQKRVRGS